ncbi:MAG TPA: YceI family protein [Candidatus Limnocylindria bacterium]|nr:YceI family protein [Candidatus Limnocylindria bacterium]
MAAALLLLTACGGATSPSPVPATDAPNSTAAATAAATAQANAISWTVDASSTATIRVREQLVRLPAPNDAIITITGARGAFTLNPDGTFASGSKISVDMTTVTTDDRRRTDTIRRDPLEVTRFPTSELVPTKATGLTLPLARSGDFAFQLTGDLTLHGVTKSVTFDVRATRTEGRLTANATANPSWKFGDFGMRPPSSFSVLSIVDEIRMEFALVANET